MQKFMKILEAQVQWIAVGLGVLWIVWTGYSYWVTPPDLGIVNGEKVSPGDVAQKVRDSDWVDKLEKASQNEEPYPEALHSMITGSDRPKYADDFKQKLAGSPPAQVAVIPSPFTPGNGSIAGPTPEEQTNKVAVLPTPQGALTLESAKDGSAGQTGMSVVWRPDPAAKLLPPGSPGADQQKTLPNPLDPTTQPLTVVPEQVTWITVSGVLDMKKLADSFQNANIAPADGVTALLKTELVRQELKADGTWSEEKVVPNLTNQFQPPWPPATGGEGDYLVWAMAHTSDVVQPPFYEVLRGQLWKTVRMPDLADTTLAQPTTFDPSKVLPGQVSSLPPDQLAAWRIWNAEQQKKNAVPRKAPAPVRTAPNPRGGAAGRANPAPSRFGATVILVGDHGDSPAAPQNRGAAPGALQPPRGISPAPQPQFVPAAPGAPPQEVPNGAFIPAQQTQDLEVWAHDETTVPGVIYRYKLKVYLKNPLFGTAGIAKDPAAEKVLAIKVETEDWSKPIQSPTRHEFFVINGGTSFNGVAKVGVDYLDWQDGSWKLVTMTLQPGDRIGQTPWTIVDLRPTGNIEGDSRVLLINDNGQMATRFYKTDRIDPLYNKLKSLVPPPAVPPGGTPSANTN